MSETETILNYPKFVLFERRAVAKFARMTPMQNPKFAYC